MRKVIFRIVALLVLGSGTYAAYRYIKDMPGENETIATTKVRKSDVIVRAYTRGELRAVRSVTLTAPNLFSTVQVTRLAPLGGIAKEGDLIVEFDDSERRAALEETLLEVEQIDEQIKKALADLAIRDNQDEVELLRSRYSVRRAELEVKRNELISEIDAKKNLLNLEEARKRLSQLESDIKSRRAQAEAELAVLREKRAKSMIDLGREKERIKQSKVISPITGLVAIRQNRTGFMTFGQQVPDIREGDTLQPGMQVADVLDLSEMEVVAKVGELDRANLREGQDVNLQLDAIPERIFHGKIKNMSATATSNPFGGDPGKKFDVVFSIDMDALLRGLGASDEQIHRVEATAAENAKKAPAAPPAFAMFGMPGGAPPAGGGMGAGGAMAGSGGMPAGGMGGAGGMGAGGMQPAGGMAGGAPGGMAGGQGGPGMTGGGGMRPGGGLASMPPEQRKAMFEQMLGRLPENVRKEVQKELKGKKVENLTQEDMRALFAKIRELTGGQGGPRGNRGGQAAAPTGPINLANFLKSLPKATGITPEEDAEMAKHKLPAAPEENSQLDVLLRPGLLADVEIIVEKIPNAINIPAQAVFERAGKMFVYVQDKKGQWEERLIQPAKRSESIMVIASGLQPGETIALADPTGQRGRDNKKKSEGSGASKSMGAVGSAPRSTR